MEAFAKIVAWLACTALALYFSYLSMTLGWGLELRSFWAWIGCFIGAVFSLALGNVIVGVK